MNVRQDTLASINWAINHLRGQRSHCRVILNVKVLLLQPSIKHWWLRCGSVQLWNPKVQSHQVAFRKSQPEQKQPFRKSQMCLDGGGTCSGWGQGRRSASRGGPLTSTSGRSSAPPASNTPTGGPGPGDSALRNLGGPKYSSRSRPTTLHPGPHKGLKEIGKCLGHTRSCELQSSLKYLRQAEKSGNNRVNIFWPASTACPNWGW